MSGASGKVTGKRMRRKELESYPLPLEGGTAGRLGPEFENVGSTVDYVKCICGHSFIDHKPGRGCAMCTKPRGARCYGWNP